MPLSQARNDKEVLAMLHSPIAKAINYVIDKIVQRNMSGLVISIEHGELVLRK